MILSNYYRYVFFVFTFFLNMDIKRISEKDWIMKNSKHKKFKKVALLWHDIKSSNEAWIEEKDILKNDIAVCTDVGFIYKVTKDKLWLFTSYSYEGNDLSVGGLTMFPRGCIKKIERIN